MTNTRTLPMLWTMQWCSKHQKYIIWFHCPSCVNWFVVAALCATQTEVLGVSLCPDKQYFTTPSRTQCERRSRCLFWMYAKKIWLTAKYLGTILSLANLARSLSSALLKMKYHCFDSMVGITNCYWKKTVVIKLTRWANSGSEQHALRMRKDIYSVVVVRIPFEGYAGLQGTSSAWK